MPVANIAEARDTVLGIIDTAWNAAAEPATWPTPGSNWPPAIFYSDVAGDVPEAQPYAVVEIQHNSGKQVAVGDAGLRRLRAYGTVTVKLYTPFGDGLTLSDYLVNIIQDALELRPTPEQKVYFRDVRVVDDDKDGVNYKVRVIANLDYDRVK